MSHRLTRDHPGAAGGLGHACQGGTLVVLLRTPADGSAKCAVYPHGLESQLPHTPHPGASGGRPAPGHARGRAGVEMAVTASYREQFRHLALFYHGRGEYLAALAGFIQASQARGDAVFVAVPEGNAQLVYQELGVNSAHVDLVDTRPDLARPRSLPMKGRALDPQPCRARTGSAANELRWLLLHLPVSSSVIWRCSTVAGPSTLRPSLASFRPARPAVTRFLSRYLRGTPSWCTRSLVSTQRTWTWLTWPSWAVTRRGSSRRSRPRNPARIIPALQAYAGKHNGRHVCCIGEPIWPGRRAAEVQEAIRHEALINLAFRDSLVTVVCPYDSAGLPGSVITDAVRTHPAVIRDRQATASGSYLGPPDVPPRCNQALSRPPVRAETLGYSDDLHPVRSFVASRAASAGLTASRIPDLVLAISELAANTVRHTEGDGTLQVWHTRGELICQVADTGHLTDPLAWHRPPSDELLGGNGLWLVNQVCDLVQARTGQAGTTIRLHMRLNGNSPRRHASRQPHG